MEKHLERLLTQYKLRLINVTEKLKCKGIGEFEEGLMEGQKIALDQAICDLEYMFKEIKEGDL